MNEVSFLNTPSYEDEVVFASIEKHFINLGLNEIIKPNMKVLLKPNLLMKRKPEEATTTHPAIIRAIIKKLKLLGVSNIVLADSPGGPYNKVAISGIYQASGLAKVCEECDITLNEDFGFFSQPTQDCEAVTSFTLINPIKDADFIINVAKLKTHGMTGLSGGVKNLFGTIPGLMKPELHFRFPDKNNFCNMLVDLAKTISPDVTFVDAVVSMEGDGPSGGIPKQTGLTLASKNPFNLDILLCELMKIPTTTILTVSNAIRRGLCVSDFSKLNVLGDAFFKIEDFKMPNNKGIDFLEYVPKFLRKPLKPVATKLLSSSPVIIKNKCIGCGKCAESCPAKTIDIKSKKAVINYDNCIKCFCCHEMCPVKAIKISRFRLFDI